MTLSKTSEIIRIAAVPTLDPSRNKKRKKRAKKSKHLNPDNHEEHETSYRHLPISQKRKSFQSMSVGGNELRKRRRINAIENEQVVERIETHDFIIEVSLDGAPPSTIHHSGSIDAESSRQEIYEFLGLSWPPERLLHLSEGQFLQNLRLKELKFTVSPTQIETPADGNYTQLRPASVQSAFENFCQRSS